MANVTVESVALCPGTGHVTLSGTVAGNSITRTYLRAELQSNPDDMEAAILLRLRSAVKEANAVSLPQIQAALIGPTFKV